MRGHLLWLGAALAMSGCAIAINIDQDTAGSQYADSAADTVQTRVVDTGVSGTMAFLSLSGTRASRADVELAISNDRQTAWLTLEGQRIRFTAQGAPATATGGFYRDGSGSRSITFGTALPDDYGTALLFGDGFAVRGGMAVIGAETRPENLPDATASYQGSYTLTSYSSTAVRRTGLSDIDVDFARSDVSGTFRDGLAATDVFGTVAGSVTGNGIEGSLTLDDPDLSGTITLDGTFFGPAAEQVGGTLLGGVDTATQGRIAVIGMYTGDRR